jgi:rare lipoprotein A
LTSTTTFALALSLATLAIVPGASANQSGKASWYSLPGNRTACGERMNPGAMTAAHRTLPCGTKIRVTNQRTGKSVIVRVNDRGPFVRGRIVDVSKSAGRKIGLVATGVASVTVAVVN